MARSSCRAVSRSSTHPLTRNLVVKRSGHGLDSRPSLLPSAPVLGGWLIEHASWHWIFFLNIPLAAFVLIILFWHVPESSSPDPGSVDWLGASIATFGLWALVSGFLES